MAEHISVLGREIVNYLCADTSTKDAAVTFVDCTLGMGGHSELLLQANPHAKLIGLDRDRTALEKAKQRLAPFGNRVSFFQADFDECLDLIGAEKANGVVVDLGISSVQLDDPSRGFSFLKNGPLDMRMNQSAPLSAETVVNEYPVRNLELVFKRGGVGPESRPLAAAIIRNRPIADTQALALLCEQVLVPKLRRRGAAKQHHPATVPFQAIRIEVNDELGQIERFLERAPQLLVDRGRLAVISFHSLEDRVVTRAMRQWERGEDVPRGLRGAYNPTTLGKLLTKQAVTADEDEVLQNPRARSARLRVFERITVEHAAQQR